MARSQGADAPKVSTTTRPPTRFPDADLLRRASCPQCTGDEAVSYRNRDGHVYCRCLTCAYRFVV